MQRVNLLNNIPVKKEYYSSAHFFLVCGSFLLLLGLVSCYNLVRYTMTYSQYTNIKHKREQAMHSLEKVAVKYPTIAREKNLIQAVSSLNSELNKKNTIYKTITKLELTSGFSPYLQALALYVPSTVSLSHIYVSQRDSNIVLLGKALQGLTVSKMVQDLYKNKRFQSNRFQEYDIRELEDGVSFQIATKTFHYEIEKKEENETASKNTTKAALKQSSDSRESINGILENYIK